MFGGIFHFPAYDAKTLKWDGILGASISLLKNGTTFVLLSNVNQRLRMKLLRNCQIFHAPLISTDLKLPALLSYWNPPKIIPSIPSIIPSTKRRVFRQSRPSISPSSVMSSFLGSVISRDQFSQEKISDLLCSQPCVEAFSWRPTKIEAGNTQVNGNKNLKPPLMDETPESYWTTGEVTFSTNIYVYIYHTIHISKCSFQIVEYPTISAMKTIPPKKLAQHSFCCKSRRYSNHGFP